MTLKQAIKDSASAPVLFILKRVYQYWLRMNDWSSVALEVRGDSARDTASLWLSLACAPVTSLHRLGRWKYPMLLFNTRVRVLGDLHFTCRAFTDQLFQVTPSAQKDVTNVLRSHLSAGDTFIDAGANIGFFTVLAAKIVGTSGTVLSVEMMPDTAATLRRHVALNNLGNVTIVENALSDRSGETLTARQPAGSAGQASVAATPVEGEAYIERHVQTTTLDEIASGLDTIALMKVDLEGHEEAAFKGGQSMLRRAKAVIFEYWPEDVRAERAATQLRDLGFNTDRRYSYNVLAVRNQVGSPPA